MSDNENQTPSPESAPAPEQSAPAPEPAPAAAAPAGSADNAQLVAILSYITLIGWIVALILHTQNKTSLGGYHVRQSLLLMLAGFIWIIPIIGWLIGIVVFVFWIMGLISAIQKQEKPVPLIGEYAQQWFKSL